MPASPLSPFFSVNYIVCCLSCCPLDAARRREFVSRVNIVKRIKINGLWKMFSIPRNAKGNYDWNAIADGRYYVEWYVGGARRREGAGVTAAPRPLRRNAASAMNSKDVIWASPGLKKQGK